MKKSPKNAPRLYPLGWILYQLNLIYYDEIFQEWDFNFAHYKNKIICIFKGHDYQWLFRFPREGERGYADYCGMVRQQNERCVRCWHPKYGLDLD